MSGQDLNLLQHKFLKKLHNYNNTSRYIFVGDRKQAIYGFAGSDTHSMDNIKKNFYLKELPLNICYRCPETVIKLSQEIVPDIEWNKERVDKGIIKVIQPDKLFEVLQPGDMILGRFNRDLLSIYKDFCLNRKRKIKFMNSELVNGIFNEFRDSISTYIVRYNRCENVEKELLKFLHREKISTYKRKRTKEEERDVKKYIRELCDKNKQIPKEKMKNNYTLAYLNLAMSEYKELGSYSVIADFDKDIKYYLYFDLIKTFIKEYIINRFNLDKDTEEENYKHFLSDVKIDDFLDYVDEFIHGNDYEINVPILSTIHGMKGKEADRVFIIDYPNFPYKFKNVSDDQLQQESNLQYVGITRAKKELYLVLLNLETITESDKLELASLKNSKCKSNIDELNRKCGIYEDSKLLPDKQELIQEIKTDIKAEVIENNSSKQLLNENIINVKYLNDIITPKKYNEAYFDNKMI